MEKPDVGDLVGILWLDATEQAGWSENTEAIQAFWTYGIFAGANRWYYLHANTHPTKDSWGGLGRIPKKSVLKIVIFEKAIPYTRDL